MALHPFSTYLDGDLDGQRGQGSRYWPGFTCAAVLAVAAAAAVLPLLAGVLRRPGYCSVVSGDEYGSSSLSLTPRGPASGGGGTRVWWGTQGRDSRARPEQGHRSTAWSMSMMHITRMQRPGCHGFLQCHEFILDRCNVRGLRAASAFMPTAYQQRQAERANM